jgi:2-polyprenyl-3-methyl-5-hydroxy-6-metoxy-1,4-benzoquinol methylase
VPDCKRCFRDLLERAFVSTESRSGPSPNGRARLVAKKLLWPARRFFDPRFTGIHQAVQEVATLQVAEASAANEAATLTGRLLDTVLANVEEQAHSLEQQSRSLEQQARSIDTLQAQVDQLHARFSFDPERSHSVAELDDFTATVLNYAASHEGFAAQANLWFNPPLLVRYEPRNVTLRWVNERIVEVPYAFRALCDVEPDAKVLDVGATESSVCLSLATLGYDVTALDPRPNPLSHKRLRSVVARIEDWDEGGEFDVVLCLSTIEHIGRQAYEQEVTKRRADLDAMKRMRELTRPGGVLVVTTAVGRASVDDFRRVYDGEGLGELLEGWSVNDITLVQRRDATTWVTIDDPIESLPPEAETVAMITATRAGDENA